jgi:hypothetical protein
MSSTRCESTRSMRRPLEAPKCLSMSIVVAVWALQGAVSSSALAQESPAGFVRSVKPRGVPRSQIVQITQAKPLKGFSVESLIVPIFVGDVVRLVRDGELLLGMVDGDEVALNASRTEYVVPEPTSSTSGLRGVLEKLFRRPRSVPSTEAMPHSAGVQELTEQYQVYSWTLEDYNQRKMSQSGLGAVLGGLGGTIISGRRDFAVGALIGGLSTSNSAVVLVGERSFDLNWVKGEAPYTIVVETARDRKVVGTTSERRFTTAPLKEPGVNKLNVIDAHNELVYEERFVSLSEQGLPACPVAQWTRATPEETALCLEWVELQRKEKANDPSSPTGESRLPQQAPHRDPAN